MGKTTRKLKVLVLHPAFSNANAFSKAITKNICDPIENAELAEFYFASAPHEEVLLQHVMGTESHKPPYLRWFTGNVTIDQSYSRASEAAAMQTIQTEFDTHGGFDVLLGYSDGAIAAAAYLYRFSDGHFPVKAAVFISGSPPYRWKNDDEQGLALDADQVGQIFTIPTLHIVGTLDPNIEQAFALYRLCEPELARILDYGKGHILPSGVRLNSGIEKALSSFLAAVISRELGFEEDAVTADR